MKPYICLLIILFFLSVGLHAFEPISCSYKKYSIDDGLPNNNINRIIQDKKGFVWIAGNSGISKFDGYNFRNYRPQPDDGILMKSDRIDKIAEDRYGRIWFETYGPKVYCFSPSTEQFWGLEKVDPGLCDRFELTQVQIKPSGKVWLLSDKNGCIVIVDSLFSMVKFLPDDGRFPATSVHSVFEDRQKNSWLLTNNGLFLITDDHPQALTGFFSASDGEPARSFFSAIEFDDEIWFGGDHGYVVKYSKKGKTFRTHTLELLSDLTSIERLNQNTILIVSRNAGFCTMNVYTGEIQVFNHDSHRSMRVNNLISIGLTQNRYFWFVSDYERGISLFDITTKEWFHFESPANNRSVSQVSAKAFVLCDNQGRTWVQPYGGGFSLFDETSRQLQPFSESVNQPDSEWSDIFHMAYFDRQGNLWFNQQASGLAKVTFSQNPFSIVESSDLQKPSLTNGVRTLFQDNLGNYWVSLKNNRILLLDKQLQKIGALSSKGQLEEDAIWGKTAYTIISDYKNRIWIGTRGDGLYRLTPKAGYYNFEVEHVVKSAESFGLNSNDIYSIFEDKNHRIWIGTFGGGINLVQDDNQGTLKFINCGNRLNQFPMATCSRVRSISEDQSGHLYLGTLGGLLVFNTKFDTPESIRFFHYEKGIDPQTSLNNNDIVDVCITRSGEVFLATGTGGLCKVLTYDKDGLPAQFKTYSLVDGLPSDNLISLIEDADGKLWIGTENVLSRFDPGNEFFEVFPEIKWLLGNRSFSEATCCRAVSGQILFGYSEGFLHFFPDQVKMNMFAPYLALTNLQLFNKNIPAGNGNPLKVSVEDSRQLDLSHKQNFFTIEFAALDFKNPDNIQYAYMLEGFDEDWNFVQNKREAVFTNVPKGRYVFKVKSTNSEGVWSDNERQLIVKVQPAFWETPLAYILYFLVFGSLIFIVDYGVLTIYRLKTDVKLEKKMSDQKQKFFIDLSHEIRTPLTMISTPVEYLMNDSRTSETVKKQLAYISQNTNRMLRLVNQILDFRKIFNTRMKVSEFEVAPFIYEIFNDFSDLANEQAIRYVFKNEAGTVLLWADKDGLEKIVMNLLSNAFKFTPKGKSITLKLTRNEKYLNLQVIDEGIGISKEKQKKLFVRFVSFNDDPSKPSTGIGLALVRELADKHGAKIFVESEVGKGSIFSVQFLLGHSHFSEDIELLTKPQNEIPNRQNADVLSAGSPSSHGQKTSVLLVEDDPELRAMLKGILEEEYQIFEAEDGKQGYEQAVEAHPDFIISDVMMPEMDGVELLRKIRSDINISHIPVILLTARTNIESKLEGLSYGADDYITKPFSIAYLKARINNLLSQRQRLRNIFGSGNFVGLKEEPNRLKEYNPKPCLITSYDEEIMERVMAIIEQNIDRSEFTVEDLASQLGLNRTSMFYKIKSLTGFAPVEFIRDIRLKRAAQLISDSQLLIKEVSYMTGFSDLKYFGKCFKLKFGVSPLEYRSQRNSE